MAKFYLTGRVPVTLTWLAVLLPTWAAAQVIMPRRVFVRKGVRLSERLLAHELCHVVQWEREGLAFAGRYLFSVLRHGYHNSPYEIEARQAESEPFYRQWACDVLIENGLLGGA